jgi:hypothetical protein
MHIIIDLNLRKIYQEYQIFFKFDHYQQLSQHKEQIF